MQRRELGRSGITVSVVGLGANNFGRPGTATETAAGTRAVIDAALDAGVEFIDTAEMYGARPGLSEEVLGEALAGRRDRFVVATKFGHPALLMPGLESLAPGSEGYIRGAVEGSLRRLRTDRIDLYQLHVPDPATPIAETVGALEALVDAGLIRAYGLSNFTADELRVAAGVGRWATVQDEYSLVRRGAEHELLPAARELGVSFLPYYPLFNGLLTGKYQRGEGPADSRLVKLKPELLDVAPWSALERYAEFCRSRGVSMLEATFGWTLARQPIASVIAGATKAKQVSANAAAAAWVPSEGDLAEISGFFAEQSG